MITRTRFFFPGLALLLFGTAILYGPLVKAGFVYDDFWFIVHNPALKTWNIVSFFADPSTVAAPGSGLDQDVYRPLATLANALMVHAWGAEPLPFHLFCLGLHLLNGFLLFGLLEKLLRHREAAIFGTLIFLWHAVQVQSVAWASQLSGLVGMAGFLISLKCFVGEKAISKKNLLLGWGAFAAAVFFKETVIILPLLLALFWKKGDARRLRYGIGIVGIALIYVLCRVMALHHLSQFAHGSGSFRESIELGLLAFPVYLGKIICPVALRVSYGYPFFSGAWMIAAPLILLGYIGAALAIRRHAPQVAQALGWILIGLLPVLQIIPIRAFVAERFLYVPMAGVAFLAGWCWKSGSRWRPLFVLWAILLGIQTARAVPVWQDERHLWQNAVIHEPTNAFAHACYAETLGDSAMAEQEYFKALVNGPSNGVQYAAFKNLAWLNHQKRKNWKAQYWLKKSEMVAGLTD